MAYEDEFVLHGVTDIEALRAYLATKLDIDATDPPGRERECLLYSLQGERKFTGKVLDMIMLDLVSGGQRLSRQNDDQVRILPGANRVPYVPEDATCRPKLQYLLDGTAKHYPGVAEDAWIMCATGTIIPEVIAAVEEFGVKCAPLDPIQAFESDTGKGVTAA